MEPRRWRPKFFNPFTVRRQRHEYLPLYRGFFRVMPLHRWGVDDIASILGYAAYNPSLFGFPEHATCIVNTAYFLPSLRSRLRGMWVFGNERGCKSIVIPSSCNTEPFDALDSKLVEPLFRWNPGVEYVYLSQHCQPMASQLATQLTRCKQLRLITLEGWNDAVAIHKIAMACKNLETIDAFSLDDPPREWRDELSVQALTTLIEMHPKLICVKATRLYLGDWHAATQFSRCKHNIALVPFSCDYVLLWGGFFLLLLSIPAYCVFCFLFSLLEGRLTDSYRNFWSVMGGLAVLGALVAHDVVGWKQRGRGWVHMHKYFILAKRRIDIMMASKHSGIAKI